MAQRARHLTPSPPGPEGLDDFQVIAWNVYLLRTNRYPRWGVPRLALEAGVSPRKIEEIERYRDRSVPPPPKGPSVGILRQLASALGVRVVDLFDEDRAKDAATRVYLQGEPLTLHVVEGERLHDRRTGRERRDRRRPGRGQTAFGI